MPQDQSITMYKRNPDGSPRSIQVTGSKAYAAAVKKQWSRTPPAAAEEPAAGAAPGVGKSLPSSGGVPPAQGGAQQSAPPSAASRFGAGVGAGVNPFHSVPSGTPSMGSGVTDMAADMLNLREAKSKFQSGDKAGGIGLGVGTGVGLAGADLIKGVGEGLRGPGKVLTEALSKGADKALKSEAAIKAADMVKTIRGNIKDANIAGRLVQPIRDILDAKYEPMHKALEKEIIPLNTAAQRLLLRVEQNAPKNIQKDVAHLFGRTALDYREAIQELRGLRTAAQGSSIVRNLADQVEKEIDAVATAKGYGKTRAELKGWYREMNELQRAAHTSIEKSTLKSALRQVLGKAGVHISAGEGKVGETEMKQAVQLMDRIQGKAKSEVMDKIGQITSHAASAYKKTALGYRAIVSALTESGPKEPL